MFLSECQACGQRELRGARSIDRLVNVGNGIELLYRCRRCATSNLAGARTSRTARTPVAAA